jgi:hypothetical protein
MWLTKHTLQSNPGDQQTFSKAKNWQLTGTRQFIGEAPGDAQHPGCFGNAQAQPVLIFLRLLANVSQITPPLVFGSFLDSVSYLLTKSELSWYIIFVDIVPLSTVHLAPIVSNIRIIVNA